MQKWLVERDEHGFVKDKEMLAIHEKHKGNFVNILVQPTRSILILATEQESRLRSRSGGLVRDHCQWTKLRSGKSIKTIR